MLGHTKTHHIDKKYVYAHEGNEYYAIPKAVAKKYLISPEKTSNKKITNRSVEQAFAHLVAAHSEAGILLKGLRVRENMTQVQFAKKIKITQANLSKMETGQRPIGKTIAKRIAKQFNVNYKYFLG